jgi:hypothetical protein
VPVRRRVGQVHHRTSHVRRVNAIADTEDRFARARTSLAENAFPHPSRGIDHDADGTVVDARGSHVIEWVADLAISPAGSRFWCAKIRGLGTATFRAWRREFCVRVGARILAGRWLDLAWGWGFSRAMWDVYLHLLWNSIPKQGGKP